MVNLFGTVERVAWGIEQKPETLRKLGETLAFMRQPTPPGDWKEAVNMFPLLKTAMAMKPKVVSTAPCQEIVLEGDNIDLYNFPIQTCWPASLDWEVIKINICLLYTSPSPRDATLSRMPSSA